MRHRKYTEQELRHAISSSFSKCEALRKLGIAAQGGNYRVINKAIKVYSIDISHFKGQAWNKGRSFGPKRPLSDYLSNSYPIQSHKLRLRLIEEGLKPIKCESCKSTKWLGKPVPLELDHIDGNHENNCLENLRLLCPNCHSMTSTFRGKNKKRA
jgi:5-methylcytosine-specific restriction endonuclease McrA